MNIVFLDEQQVAQSEEVFDKSAYQKLGNYLAYPFTKDSEVIERAKSADVLIVLKIELGKEVLKQLPNTKLIVRGGTGYDSIDIRAARELGISICNIPNYSTEIVAQWTLTQILALSGSYYHYLKAVKDNSWNEVQFRHPILELKNKTLGIIGYGEISKRLIKMLSPFSMKTLIYSNYPDKNSGLEFVDLNTLTEESDFISLHRLLSSANRGMCDDAFFKRMKKEAYLINSARAGLISEKALLSALEKKEIAGVALDGFWKEPATKDHSLFAFENAYISPHVAWGSRAARQRLFDEMARVIEAFKNGKPVNVVN